MAARARQPGDAINYSVGLADVVRLRDYLNGVTLLTMINATSQVSLLALIEGAERAAPLERGV
ncbi:MAG: hypothetical protein ACTXOO_02940 [Sodalis sp. (in: enterobacteria)]